MNELLAFKIMPKKFYSKGDTELEDSHDIRPIYLMIHS
jgi:hypothetical protein